MTQSRPLPPSLYRDTAPPGLPPPPLQATRRTRVAIIGGGFTGLSTALHLAEQGVEAMLLEAHEPGWGASGRNGGQVNPGLKHDPDTIEQDHGADRGQRMIALSMGAPDLVFSLIERHGIDCAPSRTGTLRVAFHENDAGGVRATYEQCQRRGLPVRLLDAAAMREATGTDRYVSGVMDPRGGHLNPLGYARGLARAAITAGATLHGGTRVTAMARENQSWRLSTPGGEVIADQVILGTNGYTDDLWPHLRQTVVPVFSAITATEPLPPSLAAAIMPCRSALYELGKVTVYYRLDDAGRLLMGGRSAQHEMSGPDSMRFLQRYAIKLWPALQDIRWTHGWNGQVAITGDYYPHLHQPAPGVLIGMGYNGRGVAMATATGREMARYLAEGTEMALPMTGITPIRFHRFWRIGVDARVIYGRVRDTLGI